MKKLLEQYIKSIENWGYVSIKNWNVDGTNCFVVYYTDESEHCRETMDINIWDMLVFINQEKTNI